jgi:hypothetical protein
MKIHWRRNQTRFSFEGGRVLETAVACWLALVPMIVAKPLGFPLWEILAWVSRLPP